MNEQEKPRFTSDNLKETIIMTIAVGIIAAAVYFFLILLKLAPEICFLSKTDVCTFKNRVDSLL